MLANISKQNLLTQFQTSRCGSHGWRANSTVDAVKCQVAFLKTHTTLWIPSCWTTTTPWFGSLRLYSCWICSLWHKDLPTQLCSIVSVQRISKAYCKKVLSSLPHKFCTNPRICDVDTPASFGRHIHHTPWPGAPRHPHSSWHVKYLFIVSLPTNLPIRSSVLCQIRRGLVCYCCTYNVACCVHQWCSEFAKVTCVRPVYIKVCETIVQRILPLPRHMSHECVCVCACPKSAAPNLDLASQPWLKVNDMRYLP